jgi:hypothetical protein
MLFARDNGTDEKKAGGAKKQRGHTFDYEDLIRTHSSLK